MAHYAQLDANNVVVRVIVGVDENNKDGELIYRMNTGKIWKRTSKNTKGGIHYDPITKEPSEDQSKAFRKNYANIGFTYDEERDAFIPPKPYASWVLDEDTCYWNAPIDVPDTEKDYIWNEETTSWDEMPN